jgi:RNA polymerase sigma-70 factor (ECF subfamily)
MRDEELNLAADEVQQIEALIRAARGGCRESMEKLIAASRSFLWMLALREVPSDLRPKVSASDLVQESLLEAHRDFSGFGGSHPKELYAWLRRILLNNLANSRRRYRKLKRELKREVPLQTFTDDSGRMNELPHPTPSPSKLVISAEREKRVEEALAKLSSVHQEVIRLRHKEHLSFGEIAAQLKRSDVAVRKIWSRAIERLQHELDAANDSSGRAF